MTAQTLYRDPETIEVAGRMFDVTVNRLKRARRLTMRIDTNKSLVKISAPHHVDPATLRAFLARNQAWLERQVETRPSTQVVREGSVIPFRGREYRIVVDASAAVIQANADGELVLPARGEPVLRLQRFLIAQASEDLRARRSPIAQARHSLSVLARPRYENPLGQLLFAGGIELLLAVDFRRRRSA